MDKEKAKQLSGIAKEAFAKKDYASAIKHYSEAIAYDPTDHLLFSNRSACYASLEQYQDALDDAKKCIEIKPDFARGYGRKGLAEFYLKKYTEAVKTYTDGLKIEPNNEQFKEGLEKAKAALEPPKSPFGSQQEILQKLLADPVTKEYFKDKDFLNKLKICQTNPNMLMQLMQTDPRFVKVFTVITGISMEDLENAAKEGKHEHPPTAEPMKEEMSQKPESHSHPEPMKEDIPKREEKKQSEAEKEEAKTIKDAEEEKKKGNDAYKAKKYEEALSYYDKAIAINPKEPIFLLNKASVYLEMKKFDEALKSCDDSITAAFGIMPRPLDKIAKAYARKGNCYVQMNKLNEAIEMYEKSLLEVNDYSVKELKKKTEKMKKDLEEQQYINPELAEEHKEKGNKLFRDGNYAAAIKEYDEAIKRNPKSAVMYFNRALSLMKLLDYQRALTDMQKCLEFDPKYVKAYAKKGNIHFFLKEYHKAISEYDKGLQIDPTNEECLEGKQKTNTAIYTGPHDEERAKKALDDPEIRAILADPRIQQVLKEAKENPSSAQAAMSDPFISQALQKLIAAGIIHVK